MIKHFFLRHSDVIVSRWIVVMIDIVLLNLAIILANILRFDFVFAALTEYHIFMQMMAVTMIGGLSLLLTSSHIGLIRHTSQFDLIRIVKAITIALMLLASTNYGLQLLGNVGHTISISGTVYHLLIPNSVLLIFFPLALFFLLFFRLSIKLAYYSITASDKAEKVNVVIYGAGKDGISLMHTLSGLQSSPYRVVGFMDDMAGKIGKSIQGVPIYNPLKVNNEFLANHQIREIILAMPNIAEEQKTEIFNRLLSLDIPIKSVPPVDSWINGELNLKQIQNLNIEDLLQRDAIRLDNQVVLKETFGKTCLLYTSPSPRDS